MSRAFRAAVLLGLLPASVTATDLTAPPTKLPGTVVPATPELCQPKPVPCDTKPVGCAPKSVGCESLPMTPTVPPPACPTGCVTTNQATVRDRLAVAFRGAKGCDSDSCERDRPCLTRLKEWFCWKPSPGSGLPLLRPQPYQAPLIAYFPNCLEPKFGTCGGCGPTTNCANGGCAVPTVSPKTDAPAAPPAMLPPVKQVQHTTPVVKKTPMIQPIERRPAMTSPIERAAKPYTNP